MIQRNQQGYKDQLFFEVFDLTPEENANWKDAIEFESNEPAVIEKESNPLDDTEYQTLFREFWQNNVHSVFPKHGGMVLRKFVNCNFEHILSNPVEGSKVNRWKTICDYVNRDFPSLSVDVIKGILKRFAEVNQLLYSHYLECGSVPLDVQLLLGFEKDCV